MTLTRAVFGEADVDHSDAYELEVFTSENGAYTRYSTVFLSEGASRRLLIDLVHTLSREDEDPMEVVPEEFLNRLDDVTRRMTEDAREMGAGTTARMEAINEIRDEFGQPRLPENAHDTQEE